MYIINKNFIQCELDKWHKTLAKKYNINQIAYIALYGSQNYHLSTEKSDVDVKAIYIPTLEEAIFNKNRVSTTLISENGGHCEIKDIREMNEMFIKQNINFIEILFTDFYWINPDYSIEINKIRQYRNWIAFCNKDIGFLSILGQAKNAYHIFEKSKNIKHLTKLLFFWDFLNEYIENNNYQECLFATETHFNGFCDFGTTTQELILGLKRNELNAQEFEQLNIILPTLKTSLDNIPNYYKKSFNSSEGCKELLDRMALSMIKSH